jgi:hypothetical protein
MQPARNARRLSPSATALAPRFQVRPRTRRALRQVRGEFNFMLIETAKLNGVDPQAKLSAAHVLTAALCRAQHE